MPIQLQVHESHIRLIYASIMNDFDSRLLKYNMVAVGTVFSQFLCDTFNPDGNEHVAEYEAKIKSLGSTDHRGDIRSLVNCGIVDRILAGLDYDPDPEKFHRCIISSKPICNNICTQK